jgi:outer membrane protein
MSSDRTRHPLLYVLLLILACALLLPAAATAEKGDWLLRLRAIKVDPDDSSTAISADNVVIAGSGVTVDDDTVPELDITYMLADNWGLELILATSEHDIAGTGTVSDLGEFAQTMVLPPTLLVQYHFIPDGKARPYLGAGLNYSLFYDEEVTGAFADAVGGVTGFDLDSSAGLALQFGVDFAVNEKWFINLDVKAIMIDTTATIQTGDLGVVRTDVDIDPWVFGVGFGRKF